MKIFKRRRRTNQVQVAGDNSIQVQSGGNIVSGRVGGNVIQVAGDDSVQVVMSAKNGSIVAWDINGSVSITPEGIRIEKS